MPDFEAQLHVPPVSTGIREARRFTRDQLKEWGLDSIADNAILMISELVTNAILHGGDGAVLTLLANDLKVRAEIRDSSPSLPVVRKYSETATTGRGMVIVDALASDWGTYAVHGGKVVWFELTTGVVIVDGASNHQGTRRLSATRRNSSDFRRPASPQPDDPQRFRPNSRHLFSAPAGAAF